MVVCVVVVVDLIVTVRYDCFVVLFCFSNSADVCPTCDRVERKNQYEGLFY